MFLAVFSCVKFTLELIAQYFEEKKAFIGDSNAFI